MTSNCLNLFHESLKNFMKIKKYDEKTGLNSLEHLIRNLNPEEIDDSLAKEIVIQLRKYKILNKENNLNKYSTIDLIKSCALFKSTISWKPKI